MEILVPLFPEIRLREDQGSLVRLETSSNFFLSNCHGLITLSRSFEMEMGILFRKGMVISRE